MRDNNGHNDDKEEAKTALRNYAAFVDNTLKPELERRVLEREEVEKEIEEYSDLQEQLTDKSFSTTPAVDLGHELVYCRATLESPSTVFVCVGMGFHVELTLDEAISFCAKRIGFLTKQKLRPRALKAKEVADHVKESIRMMETLAAEIDLQRTGG